MTRSEYFIYAVTSGLIYKLDWYYTVMAMLDKNFSGNKYLTLRDGLYYATVNNTLVKIDDAYIDSKTDALAPLIPKSMSVTIDSSICANVIDKVHTTVGKVILNRLILADNFNTIIPYNNGNFNIDSVESNIVQMLQSKKITVKDYVSFVDACSFVEGLSRITTVSSTPKGMLPPPGLDQFKKEQQELMTKKYGPDWIKDRSRIVEYETALKKFDNEWLKDDPANGKLLSGKVKNDARPKMLLSFGAETGFDESGMNVKMVSNSLMEGYPEDTEALTTMFNTSRAGSFSRGNETQKGGAAAKDVLRATGSIKIEQADCGTSQGMKVVINAKTASSYVGRYQIINGKSVIIEDANALIGKEITVRSPIYCKNKYLCSVCVGKLLADHPTGITLIATDISGAMLNISMKKMHLSAVSTMTFVPADAMS